MARQQAEGGALQSLDEAPRVEEETSSARRWKIGGYVAAALGVALAGGYVGNSYSLGQWNPFDPNWWTHRNATGHKRA